MLVNTQLRRYTDRMEKDLNNISSLLSKISSDIGSYLNRRLEKQGFSGIACSHGFILYLLAKNGKMTMSEIKCNIHKDKSTATALIKKLEQIGCVQKSRAQDDARVVFISLTPKGRAYTDAMEQISCALIDTCYKGFSAEEKDCLYDFLCRMEQNFEHI